MNLNVFAARLKILRSSRNLTLRQVGDAVGYSLKTIGNLENSKQPPSLNTLLLLADFFDVSMDYLVGRTDVQEIAAADVIENKNIFHKTSDDSEMDAGVFAKRLKALRLSLNLPLRSVSAAVNCNAATLSNLENGQKSPSLKMALTLAGFFGVSVDYLVGQTDNSPGNSAGDEQTLTNPNAERVKLQGMIEKLHEKDIDRALSYVSYLQDARRREL